MTISITGIAHTKFGKLVDDTLETLIATVAQEALDSAGISGEDVDAIFVGQFNAGMQPIAFPSSLAIDNIKSLWGKPATRVENACGSGSAAVHQGMAAIESGRASTVLVIGVEKMTDAGAAKVGEGLLGADPDAAGSPSTTGFAGLFADVASEYIDRYGDITDILAKIAAKSHANGAKNPYAQLRKPKFDEEFCATESAKNPVVAGPLKRTDCSPVSDGAAALILQKDAAAPLAHIAGRAHANDYAHRDNRDALEYAATRKAMADAMAEAGVTLEDLSFAEVHDCFTIAELLMYEALGLTEQGKGRLAIEEGWVYPDGKLPVNPSGGLKSKGHPVGATGVSQHVLATMQLSGQAGEMQLDNPTTALVHNMGGLGVANYVTVLTKP